jgi:methyl coenzyme M reductase gamma subunit
MIQELQFSTDESIRVMEKNKGKVLISKNQSGNMAHRDFAVGKPRGCMKKSTITAGKQKMPVTRAKDMPSRLCANLLEHL